MLIEEGSTLYTYPISRDFGFAPNPFHGVCTLATCKPRIRKKAKVGDWVIGIAGSELKPIKRKCIFIMKVTDVVTFQEYWEDPRYVLKRPCRNGSQVKLLGDNIYHRDVDGDWIQEDSHHSNVDGSFNEINVNRDTGSTENVLISDFFFYFGEKAVPVDLNSIGYRRIRDYKKTALTRFSNGEALINKIVSEFRNHKNTVIGDPYHFVDSHKRVNQETGKIT